MANDTILSICNTCGRETNHEILNKDSTSIDFPDGSLHKSISLVIRCCGCNDFSFRKDLWFTEFLPDIDSQPKLVKTTYKPARQWRKPPNWLVSIEEEDPDLKDLLDEIYSATNEDQTRLLSMGVRAVLDHTMKKILGGDFGSFEQKLNIMVERGHLTQTQRENISVVIDAGSASSHRGFKPPTQLIEEMVVVMENIVRDHYITAPMLRTAKTLIPPPPPRQKKPTS